MADYRVPTRTQKFGDLSEGDYFLDHRGREWRKVVRREVESHEHPTNAVLTGDDAGKQGYVPEDESVYVVD